MTYLDSTDRKAHWRPVGRVEVPAGSSLSCGDPCYGSLDRINGVRLAAGTYEWAIRDADENGQAVTSVNEVRLLLVGAPDVVDVWDWYDVYGEQSTVPFPVETGNVAASEGRGVDAGTMAWLIKSPHSSGPSLDWEDVLFNYSDGVPHLDGRLLSTQSGWGDGGYPLFAREVDGHTVEVRMLFISPPKPQITVEEFTALVPGALSVARDERERTAYFESVGDRIVHNWDAVKAEAPAVKPAVLSGRFGLRVSRTWYESTTKFNYQEGYDPNDLEETEYDTVFELVFPDAGLRFTSHSTYEENPNPEFEGMFLDSQYELIDRFNHLWSRLPEDDRHSLVESEDVLGFEIGTPSGSITRRSETDMVLWLTIPASAAA